MHTCTNTNTNTNTTRTTTLENHILKPNCIGTCANSKFLMISMIFVLYPCYTFIDVQPVGFQICNNSLILLGSRALGQFFWNRSLWELSQTDTCLIFAENFVTPCYTFIDGQPADFQICNNSQILLGSRAPSQFFRTDLYGDFHKIAFF